MNNAVINFPLPANEPVKAYMPGSPERVALEQELERQSKLVVDIPIIIGGKEIRTGDTGTVTCPHDHKHVLATYHKVTKKEIKMAIDATSDATMKVIMDPVAGDNITARGNGNFNVDFYNKGNFSMFGDYVIDEGQYKLSMQEVIRKDFNLHIYRRPLPSQPECQGCLYRQFRFIERPYSRCVTQSEYRKSELYHELDG